MRCFSVNLFALVLQDHGFMGCKLFSVIVHVNQALDKVRTRLQSKESKGGKWLLFHSRYLLLCKAESLNPEEQLKLGRLFNFYHELVMAWSLKEGLREWYKSSSRADNFPYATRPKTVKSEVEIRHFRHAILILI